MKHFFVVYSTVESREEALRIGRILVAERLAACVNVLGAIDSLYWWKDEIETAGEIAFLAYPRGDLVDELIARVADLHPYDCPCVVAIPLEHIYAPFAAWLDEQTR